MTRFPWRQGLFISSFADNSDPLTWLFQLWDRVSLIYSSSSSSFSPRYPSFEMILILDGDGLPEK
jgi:hypothetical protein